jgi:hypothetical protein
VLKFFAVRYGLRLTSGDDYTLARILSFGVNPCALLPKNF